MKRPNKIERMNAYLYAWAILTGCIENPRSEQSSNCICPMLAYYYKETIQEIDNYSDVPFLYPEFAKQRPESAGLRWWGDFDIKSRIAALENTINLLA